MRPEEKVTIRLTELLRSVDPKTEERVEAARRRANNAVRTTLRDRTRLSLTTEGEGQRHARQVPVKLKPGMPAHVADVEFDDDIHVLLELSRIRRLMEAGVADWSSYQEVDARLETTDSIALDPLGAQAFEHHKARFEALLEILDARDPVAKILAVESDVLGVYSYGLRRGAPHGEIELYWAIIGLVSDLLGVHVEDLTIVVLTHELAHAYTQAGFDIDGQVWDTFNFGDSDLAVKEGLAQYFTHVCLQAKADAFPSAFGVFETLRKRQPAAYSAHVDWVDRSTPEAVRRAMLEARRRRAPVTRQAFDDLVRSATAALPPRGVGGSRGAVSREVRS